MFIETVVLKAVGGEIGSASALAPKLGPLGLVSFLLISFIYFQCTFYLQCSFSIITVPQEGR